MPIAKLAQADHGGIEHRRRRIDFTPLHSSPKSTPGVAPDLVADPVPDHGVVDDSRVERDLQRLAGRTRDYREGVNAFMNKRKPEFTGQ